ncbi:MAG: right-handed parallel beta-helix repeat-containing protein, partial [Candidatus Kariarchaeaceae archaeon]|jgi:parallel beta-helix repeat protein
MNNVGSGVFLLESTTTGISNNQILSNGGEGVLLINSSQNAIDSNLVDSNGLGSAALIRDSLNADNLKLHGFFGSGIYLDPSPFNNVTNNVITNSAGAGVYFLETNYSRIADNFISGSGDSAIAFVDSSFNEIISNAIENNGAAAASLAIGLDGFFGSGIYLDPSHFNNIIGNNVSGSAGDGFASESSTNSHVQDNRFFENLGYGVNLDVASSNSFVGSNNFQDNTANKQARDDGIFNAFSNNFWSDGNNTDANYDGIADDPYNVDGNAGTTDSTASNIPKGLNFYTAQIVEVTPTKINAGSEGTPVTFKIELTDGFRALNIDVTNSWLNGTVQAESFHVIDILRFTVTFPRQQVNDLINSLGLVEPFFVTLEAVILMNDGLLEVTASDLVEVNQSEGGMVLVLGLSGSMVTAVGVRRESKYTKALSKLRSIFNK